MSLFLLTPKTNLSSGTGWFVHRNYCWWQTNL